jgi:hypothetical protein
MNDKGGKDRGDEGEKYWQADGCFATTHSALFPKSENQKEDRREDGGGRKEAKPTSPKAKARHDGKESAKEEVD